MAEVRKPGPLGTDFTEIRTKTYEDAAEFVCNVSTILKGASPIIF